MEDIKELDANSWKVKATKNKKYTSKHLHLTRKVNGSKLVIDSHAYGNYDLGNWEGYIKVGSSKEEVLVPCIESISFGGFVARINTEYKKVINKYF